MRSDESRKKTGVENRRSQEKLRNLKLVLMIMGH